MRWALLAFSLAAFADAGAQPAGGVAPAVEPSQVLLVVPAGADRYRVMLATHNAFVRRKWAVGSDASGAVVARNRNFDVDATLKVFLAGSELRYVDGTVDTKGRKAQVPERWLNYIRADLRRQLDTPPERRVAPPKDMDPADRLRRLKSMLDAGLISQAEYDAKRAEIVKGL